MQFTHGATTLLVLLTRHVVWSLLPNLLDLLVAMLFLFALLLSNPSVLRVHNTCRLVRTAQKIALIEPLYGTFRHVECAVFVLSQGHLVPVNATL